nr:SDR family NAD(P)-dependent oxidoreductase [Bacillus velezensis]
MFRGYAFADGQNFKPTLLHRGKTLALRNDHWFAQELLTVQTQPSTEPVYRNHGVYVVIGGAGGVGELWTRYMIEHYQASIVWIGRRPINKQIQEKIHNMESFAKHGASVPHYISADASDKEQLTRAYEKIRERFSYIHGVVHSAIVLADQSLGNMDEERFISATSAKIDTSIHMVEIFSQEKLDFILFSLLLRHLSEKQGKLITPLDVLLSTPMRKR